MFLKSPNQNLFTELEVQNALHKSYPRKGHTSPVVPDVPLYHNRGHRDISDQSNLKRTSKKAAQSLKSTSEPARPKIDAKERSVEDDISSSDESSEESLMSVDVTREMAAVKQDIEELLMRYENNEGLQINSHIEQRSKDEKDSKQVGLKREPSLIAPSQPKRQSRNLIQVNPITEFHGIQTRKSNISKTEREVEVTEQASLININTPQLASSNIQNYTSTSRLNLTEFSYPVAKLLNRQELVSNQETQTEHCFLVDKTTSDSEDLHTSSGIKRNGNNLNTPLEIEMTKRKELTNQLSQTKLSWGPFTTLNSAVDKVKPLDPAWHKFASAQELIGKTDDTIRQDIDKRSPSSLTMRELVKKQSSTQTVIASEQNTFLAGSAQTIRNESEFTDCFSHSSQAHENGNNEPHLSISKCLLVNLIDQVAKCTNSNTKLNNDMVKQWQEWKSNEIGSNGSQMDTKLCIEIIRKLTESMMNSEEQGQYSNNSLSCLRKLRLDHLRHIQREVLHVEELDKFLSAFGSRTNS